MVELNISISPSFPSQQISDEADVFVEMPQRNSRKQDHQATMPRRSPRFAGNNTKIREEPTTVLRRSPRILAKNRDESEDLKTPIQEKKGPMEPYLDTSCCVSTPEECLKALEPRDSVGREVLKEVGLGNRGSRRAEQLKEGGEGLRRSVRLAGKENVNWRVNFDVVKEEEKDLGSKGVPVARKSARKSFKETGFDVPSFGMVLCDSANQQSVQAGIGLPVQSVGEMKKTCKSREGNAQKLVKCARKKIDKSVEDSKAEQSVQAVIGLPVQSVGEAKKTGNSSERDAQKIAKCVRKRTDKSPEYSKAELLGKGVSSEIFYKSGIGASDQETAGGSSTAPVEGRVEKEARAVEKKPKCIGVKRKRNQVEDCCENQGTISGWTKEQESALQKAYLAADPTPRFWKDVAKKVPGKSAQDCFDRVHADHLTPRPRSRAKVLNSSPVLYSPSKLLDSIRSKSKRPGHTKQKGQAVQKTMRKLLQKEFQVNREQNADLFSILEPQVSLSPNALQQGVNCSTPKQENPKLLRRCQETSSSDRRKQCLQINSMNEARGASPPVLKPVKNKALHEKYIDKLHARRRAGSAKAAKSSLQARDRKECRVQKNAVESAKNALLDDARVAIKQYQHKQANDFSIRPDDDDDVLFGDEDTDGENSL
ncbi:uncharacterized protein LOC108196055 [Daucus carota subsp. sativus]|uniref:uncharacterized protein LOC108196055 n=1 Tax=Daucus carota subsp. sativus TaxID=79200 RepID=UPI003083A1D0